MSRLWTKEGKIQAGPESGRVAEIKTVSPEKAMGITRMSAKGQKGREEAVLEFQANNSPA